MAQKPVYVFTHGDIALIVALIAGLNPENYKSDEAKYVIYKCKNALKDDDITFRIVPG